LIPRFTKHREKGEKGGKKKGGKVPSSMKEKKSCFKWRRTGEKKGKNCCATKPLCPHSQAKCKTHRR